MEFGSSSFVVEGVEDHSDNGETVDYNHFNKIAYKTKVSRNANMGKLQAGYLFPEIARRRSAPVLKYPDAQVISLGIGDTTEPIPEFITSAMAMRSRSLSTIEGYSGYGAEQGDKDFSHKEVDWQQT